MTLISSRRRSGRSTKRRAMTCGTGSRSGSAGSAVILSSRDRLARGEHSEQPPTQLPHVAGELGQPSGVEEARISLQKPGFVAEQGSELGRGGRQYRGSHSRRPFENRSPVTASLIWGLL